MGSKQKLTIEELLRGRTKIELNNFLPLVDQNIKAAIKKGLEERNLAYIFFYRK